MNDRGSDRVTPCRCRCMNTWPVGDNEMSPTAVVANLIGQ